MYPGIHTYRHTGIHADRQTGTQEDRQKGTGRHNYNNGTPNGHIGIKTYGYAAPQKYRHATE